MNVQNNVRDLIANSKIEQAIDELINWSISTKDFDLQNSMIMLKSRYISIKKQENLGLVTYTDALREQAFISHTLLELLSRYNEKDNKSSNVSPEIGQRDTILFLAANPTNTAKLQLDKEFLNISLSLQEGLYDYRLVAEFAITPNDLQSAILKHKPKIIHFSGHGEKGDPELMETATKLGIDIKNNAGLILQDSNGLKKLVSGKALANLFSIIKQKIDLQIVLLNACYSDEQAKSIGQFIPYVIGMNNPIGDLSAIAFSTGFYRGISTEKDIEYAFDLAKNMIIMEGLDDENIPVLYKQSK